MRRRALILSMALLAAAVVWPVDAESKGSREEFQWTGRLADGQVMEVKGVNGSVRAQGTSGGEVEVTAIKRGRHSDPAEVTIEVVEHAAGITLCAVYPGRFGDSNKCLPGSKGKLGTDNNDVKVDFEVYVPSGVRFVGRTVNGSIKIESLEADAEAYTVNGGVELETEGAARAETVNGCITAEMGASSWDDSILFETVNGSITVILPESVSAEVSAKTTNGTISSDFPLKVERSKYLPGRSANGTLGSGGERLKLKTVNGTIRLRSR